MYYPTKYPFNVQFVHFYMQKDGKKISDLKAEKNAAIAEVCITVHAC